MYMIMHAVRLNHFVLMLLKYARYVLMQSGLPGESYHRGSIFYREDIRK
jgi:hypothetical protein